MASKESLNRKIQILEKEVGKLKLNKTVILKKAKSKIDDLSKMNKDLLRLSMELDEHPEGYNGPCYCKTCLSYGGDQ